MAMIAQAIIRDFPEFYLWHAIREFVYNGITQHNRNRLLWRDESVDGLKTGYTKAAGYCLVVSAKRDGMRLVSAILGSASEKARTRQTQTLLTYGFRFFETHRLYGANQPITNVRIWKGDVADLGIGLLKDLYVTVPRGQYKKLEAKMEVEEQIMAPVAKGDASGAVKITLGDKLFVERPLVALQTVSEGALWRRMLDHVMLMFE